MEQTIFTSTSTTSKNDPTRGWYDVVGPLIGLIFVLAIFMACCKCVFEICKEKCSQQQQASNREQRRGSDNANFVRDSDVPPRYSTSGFDNVDLDNIVVLPTVDGTRTNRHQEDKLPTYSEVIEENLKRQANYSSEEESTSFRTIVVDNEILEESSPSPPPYTPYSVPD